MFESFSIARVPSFDQTQVRSQVVDVPVFLFLDSGVSPDAGPQAAGAECAADVDVIAVHQVNIAERTYRHPAGRVTTEYECIRARDVRYFIHDFYVTALIDRASCSISSAVCAVDRKPTSYGLGGR